MSTLAVSGTFSNGKTSFIDALIKKCPVYKKVDLNIYDFNNLDWNSIEKKFDNIKKMLNENKKEDNIIYDGSLLDFLAYCIPICERDENTTIMNKMIYDIKEHMSKYDVIFYVPLLEKYQTVFKKEKYDGLLEVRKGIGNIFNELHKQYVKGKCSFLPHDDCPAIIEIFGNTLERVCMAEMYVNTDGTFKV